MGTATLAENAFTAASKSSTITVTGVTAADLKIGAGATVGSTKTATDTTTGVTATIDGTGANVTLSGTPKAAGTATFTIGTDAAKATLTVNVGKATLTTATVACTAADNKVVLTVDSNEVATALATELKNKKTDLVFTGAANADTALAADKITTIEAKNATVEIAVQAGALTAGQKVMVKLAGLNNFNNKDSNGADIG